MIEARLAALADDAFPATPDVAAAVAERLRTSPVTPTRQRPRWLRAWVVVAALLVPTAALAAVLGFPGVRIVRVAQLPPLPDLAGADLGPTVPTVPAATRRAGFAVRAIARLGRPAAIHAGAGAVVTLVYAEVVVTELRARPGPEVMTKTIGPDTRVEHVDVEGAPGVFLSGAPHELTYMTPTGRFAAIPPRLAGNALAFQRDGLIIRIEGERLTLRRALALARTVR